MSRLRTASILFGILAMCGLAYTTAVPVAHATSIHDISPGDTFIYDICDNVTRNSLTALDSQCYTLSLMFVMKAPSLGGAERWVAYTWVWSDDDDYDDYDDYDGRSVTGVAGGGGERSQPDMDIIVINAHYEVEPFFDRYTAESLENTLFWPDPRIFPYGSDDDGMQLHVGDVLGNSKKQFDHAEYAVLDFVKHDGQPPHTDYILGHGHNYGDNRIVWRDTLPLAISATIYQNTVMGEPPLRFSYELIEHYSGGQQVQEMVLFERPQLPSSQDRSSGEEEEGGGGGGRASGASNATTFAAVPANDNDDNDDNDNDDPVSPLMSDNAPTQDDTPPLTDDPFTDDFVMGDNNDLIQDDPFADDPPDDDFFDAGFDDDFFDDAFTDPPDDGFFDDAPSMDDDAPLIDDLPQHKEQASGQQNTQQDIPEQRQEQSAQQKLPAEEDDDDEPWFGQQIIDGITGVFAPLANLFSSLTP